MTALAAELPRIFSRVPAEQLARACGKTLRSVNRWIEGHTQPSAIDLVVCMREFHEVSTEVLKLAGKRPLTDCQMRAAKQALQILAGAGDDTSP